MMNKSLSVMELMVGVSSLLLASSGQAAACDCPGSTRHGSVGAWTEATGSYLAIETTSAPPLFEKQSEHQYIEVYESDYYGKILVLDGVIQITERDADSYNEMMAHVPMMIHPSPKRALVIGGGDGYVLKEILKYDSIEHVDYVDLDEDVIEACKQYFPYGKNLWDDPRITVHIADGADFVRKAASETYDVIVQDSSDPWTTNSQGEMIVLPSSILYTSEHFTDIHRILTSNGIFNFQAEAFIIPADLQGIVDWRNQALRVGFQRARYGSLYISSYPTGQIGFLVCEKDRSSSSTMSQIKQRFKAMQQAGKTTTYFHPRLQQSTFDLPLWVEKTVYGEQDVEQEL